MSFSMKRHNSVAELHQDRVQKHPAKVAHHAKVIKYDKKTAIAVLLEGKMSDELLEHWDILHILGQGAFGTVFEVGSTVTDERAALKVIQKAKVDNKEDLKTELEALTRCAHKSTTRLKAMYEDEHAQYLIIEKCNGGDMLDYLMDKGPLGYTEAAFLFREMIKGLAYIHDREIVHRDMKLDNLLLVEKDNVFGGVKISDFGIVHLFSFHENVEERKQAMKTETVDGAEFAGSLQYMAPEIVKGVPYDFKVDMWSAGVILYTMMFASFPFGGGDAELMETLRTTKGVDLTTAMFAQVDKDLIDLLQHLLDVNPETRFDVADCLKHPWLVKMQSAITAKVPADVYGHATPGQTSSDPFPPGWTRAVAANGKPYYSHTVDGHVVSTWTDPRKHKPKNIGTSPPASLTDALNVESVRRHDVDGSVSAVDSVDNPENAMEELLGSTMAPEVVNKYRTIKPLGHGAYGTVILVEQRATHETCALKLIQKKKVTDPSDLKNELDTLNRCHHYCITSMLYSFEDAEFMYVGMEACPGGDLLDFLLDDGAPMRYIDSSFLFKEITKGVAYLHSKGVLHRDLKPDNILLVQKGDIYKGIKICDFGLAQLFPEHAGQAETAVGLAAGKDLVTDGTVAGTYLYIAPEILRGGNYSYEVDLWSMGVILHASAFGFFPFDNDDQRVLCSMIASTNGPDFSSAAWKAVDADLLALVTACLTPDPLKRITCKGIMNHKYSTKFTKKKPAGRIPSKKGMGGRVKRTQTGAATV